MKKILLILPFILLATTVMAQEQNKKKRFSPEEFQAKQKEFITGKAELSQSEAEAFFPIFFELQKNKFEIERNARKSINRKRGEKMTEEQCRELVNNVANAKIKVAALEKDYIEKYLKVISPCKLLKIQHAEGEFQRELMKKMTRHREERKKDKENR